MNAVSPNPLLDGIVTTSNDPLQFSKNILKFNGELRDGQIPEILKYSRPFEMTCLDNGIRVCTEHWPCGLAAIGVIIGAGSRHETLETSGTAHFMEHLHFKVQFIVILGNCQEESYTA